jgi:Uma2 family endonuclease
MAVAKKLLTAEEFWLLPEREHAELEDGEVIETVRPGGIHGAIAAAITALLWVWARQAGLGHVGQEAGFILRRNPDRVRGPDVYFVRKDRIPPEGIPEKFWEIAPDLAVEVISPSDTAEVVKGKLEDYFLAGTSLVWLVYPKYKQVEAHTPGGVTRVFREGEVLEAPELLTGFSCKVKDLFGS